MHLARLRLRDFRNFARLDAVFQPGFHVFLGDNAQGKTNLLESIYLLATLRSFRGVGGAQLIRHHQKHYFVGATLVTQNEHDVRMFWSIKERQLSLDNQPVRRLLDYYGVWRAVVFCSEDLQLVKGTARVRRRFLDLLLAQTDSRYLATLQRYMKALRSRNALLKQAVIDPLSLGGFTEELVRLGNELLQARHLMVPRVAALARAAHHRIAPASEELSLDYQPSVKTDFAVELASSHRRERSYRATLVGPHRDDLRLMVNQQLASQYASEGQKRTIAIALKMAQAEYLADIHGTPPVLLIDDVMGELDARRRSGFLPLLETARQGRGQVFMTCTEENWPAEIGETLQRWSVTQGKLSRLNASSVV